MIPGMMNVEMLMTLRMTGMMRPPGRPDCLGPRPHPVWRLPPLQLTNTLTALVFKSFGFTIMSIQNLYHHCIFSIFMTFYEANKPLLVDSIILFVISNFHNLCSSFFDEMCVVSAEHHLHHRVLFPGLLPMYVL